MEKSQYDTRDYRTFTLENGLRVILVNDKEATKSAGTLTVGAGSFDESIMGSSHFLEHLLFMGNAKYPDENYYDSFISEHGGCTNAYTSNTYTCYLFEINSDKFVDALDIFSQMFISSLLNESAVDREMKAVNSEFMNYHNSDSWRSHEVLKSLANPNHPFSKFSVGNTLSLNIPNIVDHVRQLYNDRYSSNLMNLCLVSNIELDELESQTRRMFSQIQNKNLILNKKYPIPFTTNLQKTIKIVPIKNTHKMSLSWQIQNNQDEMENWRYKPSSFLGHILGHEGKGSILYKLKSLNWASSLQAGVGESFFTYDIFELSIILTNEGIANVNNVLNIIYDYVNICASKMQNFDTCKYLYDDNKNSNYVNWLFAPKQNCLNESISMASIMHSYDFISLEKMKFASHYCAEFDDLAHSLILKYLSQFTQQNSLINLSSKQFEAEQSCYCVEQWYQALYKVEKSDTLDFAMTFNGLDLPAKNLFIPENVSTLVSPEDETIYPVQFESEKIKVFVKKTNKFGLPHAYSSFLLKHNNSNCDTLTHVSLKMLTRTIMSQLNDTLYDSQLLQYYVNVVSENGISITTYGFYDKLEELLKLIVDVLLTANIEESFFDLVKEQYLKELSNEKFSESSHRVYNILDSYINSDHMSIESKIKVIENMSYIDLVNFTSSVTFDNCVALFEGNVNEDMINSMTNLVGKLNISNLSTHVVNNIIVPKQCKDELFSHITENPNELNDCISVTYLYSCSNPVDNPNHYDLVSKMKIINLFLKEAFFDELRTKQQLGYTVGTYNSSVGRSNNITYLQQFLIQSPHTKCEELLNRINSFVDQMITKMQNLDDTMFQTYINTMLIEVNKPADSLINEAIQDVSVLVQGHEFFNKKELLNNFLERLQKSDIIDFFVSNFKQNTLRCVVNLSSTCMVDSSENVEKSEKCDLS
jgi:insulysin